MTDMIVFLKRFLSEPGRVGSVAPSSRFLCKEMMKRVPWHAARTIVELGPGTGAFTGAILRKKRPDAIFFVIERDLQFRKLLESRFPGLIVKREAMQLNSYLAEMKLEQVDAIISGLPFAIFSPELRTAILDEVVKALAPGGVFVTFQYSLQLHDELQQRFSTVEIGFTALNIPPAFIYMCRK
ncbi:methyltransferase [Brevibacillus sp. SYP-B805]|uniref:methyltransferase n=1 Tax=Brevibacillus sp. SYP-B805 TaxID=1578199 RepID=UPI0013ECB3D4|nr:methyltransferase [Brevibacillus sp. SYP-B805]